MKILLIIIGESRWLMVDTDMDADRRVSDLAIPAGFAWQRSGTDPSTSQSGFATPGFTPTLFRYADLKSTDLSNIIPIDPDLAIATLRPMPCIVAVFSDSTPAHKALLAASARFAAEQNPAAMKWIKQHTDSDSNNKVDGAEVFLSYSTTDSMIAEDIAARVRQRGYRVFLAHQTITVGPTWQDQVAKAAQACRLAILLVSKTAVDSAWVKFEIGALWGLGKRVAPALLGVAPSALPALVSQYQGRDVTSEVEREAFCDEVAALLASS